MAPHVKDSKQYDSKLETKTSLHNELLKKLKLEEEKEKKKLEKETKRRAELEKMKQESLEMQATLQTSSKNKTKKQSVQPKKSKPLPKQISNSFTALKSKSTSVSKENDSDIWCESAPSNSAANDWTSQQNSYNSKTKPSNYSKQTSYTSKSNYSRGSSYERSRSRCDSNSSENQYRPSRYTPVSNSAWDSEENFPALAPVPKVNVWSQRISKAEEIKALQPQTIYDEEAMLRQALELSMKEAQEDELRRKFEEELLLQAEALEVNPEFNEVLDEFEQKNHSEYESSTSLHSDKNPWIGENKSNYSSSSYASKKEDGENSRDSKDLWTMDNNSNYTSTSYHNKKEKNANSRSTRPKINKIIDSFGGWGLSKPGDKIEKRSEKLSDFVAEVIDEKHKSVEYHDDAFHKKNSLEKHKMHEEIYSKDLSDPWLSTEPKNVKESIPNSNCWKNKEILYDSKDIGSAKDNQHHTFYDNNVVVDEETEEVTQVECQDMSKSSKNKRFGSKIEGTNLAYNKSVEDGNDILSYDSIEEKEYFRPDAVNVSETSFKYDKNSASSDYFHSEHEILNLPSTEPCVDQPVSSEISFCDKLNPKNELEVKSFKFADAVDVDFDPGVAKSDIEVESSHILPPHPASSMPVTNDNENTFFASGIPISNNQTETPLFTPQPVVNDNENTFFGNRIPDSNYQTETPIFTPQPAPAFQPTFPLMNPLLPNLGMFPGGMHFNPMMGYVMDPMMMRQMLMLSNPFFASQLLSMEQYFKAQGIATDTFSMRSQTVENPLTAGSSQQPNMFGNVMNPAEAQFQFQTQVPRNNPIPPPRNVVDSSNDEPCVKHDLPPGLDTDFACSRIPNEVRLDGDDDSWFKSYFSNDNSVSIPPPKLPAAEVDPIPAPKSLPPNQSTSGFNQNSFDNVSISAYPASNTHKTVEDFKPLPAEACITKASKNGWSDSEDESTGTRSRKWSGDDDGWGDDTETEITRPVKQSLKYEERRRPSNRQPASRPQFSHPKWRGINK